MLDEGVKKSLAISKMLSELLPEENPVGEAEREPDGDDD
jgi:hypothetical protein